MNWKKLLLIAAITVGFAIVSAPKSEARVAIAIGIGLPVAYPVGYYGGYPYGYGYPYAYGYPYYASYGYFGYGRPFYGRSYGFRQPFVAVHNRHHVYHRR